MLLLQTYLKPSIEWNRFFGFDGKASDVPVARWAV